MIISDTSIIKITGSNFKYYEKLGYLIPKNNNKIIKGSKIFVKVKHLTKCSTALIQAKCEICGKIREQKFCNYKKICVNCSRSSRIGIKSPTYKDGRTIINHLCIDCGKQVSNYNNKRCRKCYEKNREIKNFCIDCGKKISRKAIRCLSCFQKGKNNNQYNYNLTDKERYLSTNRNYYPGYLQWQRDILKRDHYQCQYPNCNCKDNLRTHHLNSWSKFSNERVDINNGITLCKEHHKLLHKKFGYRNNKEQFNKWINNE